MRQSALARHSLLGRLRPRTRLLERPLCPFPSSSTGKPGTHPLTADPIQGEARSLLRGMCVLGKQVGGDSVLEKAVKTWNQLGRTAVEPSWVCLQTGTWQPPVREAAVGLGGFNRVIPLRAQNPSPVSSPVKSGLCRCFISPRIQDAEGI